LCHIPIAPLARSIGDGLSISTLLTLFLVPTMYMIFEERHPRKSEKEETQAAIRLEPTTPFPGLE